ncbi:MAG: M14 family metallopeptidase [Verrucomicrobiae bacterium]|nr:M14 family metallopeptidase [Verrucomicrobiae bacterium]
MTSITQRHPAARLCAALLFSAVAATARVTSPKEQFGFNIGDDHCLVNYGQMIAYWERLAKESPRIRLTSIGTTEEGRTQTMAIVSAPANLHRLDRYREISRRLALAEGLTDAEARELANRGRAVVWIDGGLHATETVGSQQLIETVYRLLNRTDAEVARILDNVIVLLVPANPDGMDLVADWYMREPVPEKRTYANLPRLYQKYIGHDNNRDFYAVTQAETKNMCRILYREWFPQIIYNHHQSAPPGTVMFIPPFRDPFNYHYDVRVINGLEAVCAAIMMRFLDENKPGVTCRSGARYSAWYSGGLRTSAYFHNAIGILSEIIGSPAPTSIPYKPELQLPRNDLLAPIEPQRWHMRQSIEYSFTANIAVLDYAARNRFQILWNRYAMGRDAIRAGSRDSWIPSPSRIERAKQARKKAEAEAAGAKSKPKNKSATHSDTNEFALFFRNPAERAPYAYVLPSSQTDFPTAVKFINSLIENGVRVFRATNDFTVGDKTYPAHSFIVPCAQAFRAQVLDMFEPQDHPNDLEYPGGPPIPPYDMAGWTLAMQMAVQFDRLYETPKGPFVECHHTQKPPPGKITPAPSGGGYYLRADANDAFRAVNRLIAAQQPVQRLTIAAGEFPAGTFYLPQPQDPGLPSKLSAELGVNFSGGTAPPADAVKPLRPIRVGLWDRYGGSIPSGWPRWLLERFEFPFELVFPPRLDRGNLRKDFDLLVFVTGAIPSADTNLAATARTEQPRDEDLPHEYRARRGSITIKTTVPRLREFLEAGGVILTIGSSTALAKHLGLPIENHLLEPANKAGAKPKPLPREKFYIPGSLVQITVDNTHPIAWGMMPQATVMFHNSPVFQVPVTDSLRKIAWFDDNEPLRSGWAIGQEHLKGGTAALEAQIGNGRLLLFGPEILFRAQSHGTFKFLFNAILNTSFLQPQKQ